MSNWETATTRHNVIGPGNAPYTAIWVSAAIEQDNNERPKFILEERSTNTGRSLNEPEILSAAIQQVSRGAEVSAKEADWYVLGQDDELYAVNVEEETTLEESAHLRNLVNSGDLSVHEIEDARKALPNQPETEIKVETFPIGPEQSIQLGEAFAEHDTSHRIDPEAAHHVTPEEWREAELPSEHRYDNDVGHDL